MPHNNRVSASTALKTNDIWSKTIGYDPYAAANDDSKQKEEDSSKAASLMLLARLSNVAGAESRGGCKRCGMLGHMHFQCRNPIASASKPAAADNDDDESSSDESDQETTKPTVSSSRPTSSSVEDRGRERVPESTKRSRSPSPAKRTSHRDERDHEPREKKSKKRRYSSSDDSSESSSSSSSLM